jgi:hypothetical protein
MKKCTWCQKDGNLIQDTRNNTWWHEECHKKIHVVTISEALAQPIPSNGKRFKGRDWRALRATRMNVLGSGQGLLLIIKDRPMWAV